MALIPVSNNTPFDNVFVGWTAGAHPAERKAVLLSCARYLSAASRQVGKSASLKSERMDYSMIGLTTLLGEHAVTGALKDGRVSSPLISLDFASVRETTSAFWRVVGTPEFDLAELPIMTFLIAKAHGAPLSLLPSVIFARFPHPYLVYNPERGSLAPADLEGRRVGIRSYSVTTVAYIRDILTKDFGIDCGRIDWVSIEKPHVATYAEPSNVSPAPKGKTLAGMLSDGEIDAAILGANMGNTRLASLIQDQEKAISLWQARSGGALPINHVMVIKAALSQDKPEAVSEVFRLLCESKAKADLPTDIRNSLPFGVDACRRSLEFAIDMACSQDLIPQRFEVDELFDDVTRML